MIVRCIIILLALVTGLNSLAVGTGQFVLCLGGGHEHGPAESEHCESACAHSDDWPMPSIPVADEEHCDCTDIAIATADLLVLPRVDDATVVSPLRVMALPVDWMPSLADAGVGPRGPPRSPSWFDPRGEQRLAVLSSFRLLI